ncbi:PEGA domain-containing protein [Candidatus Dojkabacteria bacterium]|nr:PEGA domain-containing protein [Candidatus Dojkabacteria bacterium]
MSKFRTIVIVVGVVLIFTLIAALSIIIAQGGKLTPDRGFVKTGIIRITSKPQDVKVYVDGEEKSLQDKQIGGLEDREYLITISKEGYSTWERTVKVEPGIVIEIFAQLFPTSLNLTEVTKTNIDKVFYSKDGQYAVYVVKDSEIGGDLGIWKLRLSKPTITIVGNNKPIKLSNITSTVREIVNADYEIELSPDNRFIMIHNTDTNEYFILNAELYNEPEESLNKDLGFVPDRVDWFTDSTSLVVARDSTLFEYNLREETSSLISLTPGKRPVYSVNESRIILYNHNKKTFEFYDGEKSKSLIVENIHLPVDIEQIQVSELTPNLLIFETNNTFYYLNVEKSFISEIGKDLEFVELSRSGKSALFLKEKTLISYEVREIISERRFESKIFEILKNFDKSVQKARWSTDSEHIVISGTRDKLKTIAIFDKEGENMNELIADKRFQNDFFKVPANSSSLFLLLNDEVKENGEDHILRTNLYELDLEKPSVK